MRLLPTKTRSMKATILALALLLPASWAPAKGMFSPVDFETAQNFHKGIKKGFDDFQKYKKMGEGAGDFLDKYDPLTKDDEDFDDAYDDPTAPQVPSSCADSGNCGACFENAYENLNRQRFRLAKLERIYKSTKRMGKSAIAFGDNVSGIHGAAGLGWQLQGRKPIEESMKSFQQTSERKYEEIIGDLHGALQEVAVCEEEHYDEQDWYNRFGFIYYTFMAERYRPDAY